jgi:hypothetical protein
MKVRFAVRSILLLWRDWVEGPKDIEEWSTERPGPRNRVDAVGNGVADPSKSSKAFFDVGWCLRRTDGCARFFENFEKSGFSSVDRKASVAAYCDEVECRG